MTSSDLEWLSEIFNDMKHRAVSLRQPSFFWYYSPVQCTAVAAILMCKWNAGIPVRLTSMYAYFPIICHRRAHRRKTPVFPETGLDNAHKSTAWLTHAHWRRRSQNYSYSSKVRCVIKTKAEDWSSRETDFAFNTKQTRWKMPCSRYVYGKLGFVSS